MLIGCVRVSVIGSVVEYSESYGWEYACYGGSPCAAPVDWLGTTSLSG